MYNSVPSPHAKTQQSYWVITSPPALRPVLQGYSLRGTGGESSSNITLDYSQSLVSRSKKAMLPESGMLGEKRKLEC